jgi:hypothetical protein
MPAEFDKIVNALKKDHSEDSAYAIATAQWKKSHGGKLPSGKYPKEKGEGRMERLEHVIKEAQKVLEIKKRFAFQQDDKFNLQGRLSRAGRDYTFVKNSFDPKQQSVEIEITPEWPVERLKKELLYP